MNLSKVRPIFEAIERAVSTRNASPIHFYQANPGCQDEFHKSQAFMRIILGANSSGKSFCGLGAEVAYHVVEDIDIEGNSTGYAVHPYRKIRLPVIGAISSATEEVQARAEGGTQSYFLKFLEQEIVDAQMERGSYKKVELKGGSKIEFITDASGRKAYQGATFDFIAMDEPHQPTVVNEAKMRLVRRPNCRIWWAFTPVIDPNSRLSVANIQWAIKEVVRPAMMKQNKGDFSGNTRVWHMPATENKHVDYDMLIKATEGMSKEEREVRLTGRYIDMMIMSGFDIQALEELENHCIEPVEASLELRDNIIVPDEKTHYMPSFKEGHIYHFWDFPKNGHKYVIGVDVGGRTDPTSATVIDINHHCIAAEFHGWIQETDLARQLQLLGFYYNAADMGIETNKEGQVTVTLLQHGHPDLGIMRYPNLYKRPKPALLSRGYDVPGYEPGWLTTGGARGTRDLLIGNVRMFFARALDGIKRGFENACPSIYHIDEATTFSPNMSGKLEAESGKHDDRIISLGIALQVMKRVDETNWLQGDTQRTKKIEPVFQTSPEGIVNMDFGFEDTYDPDQQSINKDFVS